MLVLELRQSISSSVVLNSRLNCKHCKTKILSSCITLRFLEVCQFATCATALLSHYSNTNESFRTSVQICTATTVGSNSRTVRSLPLLPVASHLSNDDGTSGAQSTHQNCGHQQHQRLHLRLMSHNQIVYHKQQSVKIL